MKRYVPIIIGVVALCAVLYLGSNKMESEEEILTNNEATSTEMMSKSFQGSVTRGENTLEYGFDLPETAATSMSMDNALITITDSDAPVLAMYVSFEGTRGYSPADYITKNIMPKVNGVTERESVTLGAYDWKTAESANSEWHVASTEDGKWLLVVENKKSDNEKAMEILKSLSTK